MCIVVGLFLARRLGLHGFEFSVVGDSVTTLSWVHRGRAKSTVSRRCQVVYAGILIATAAQPGYMSFLKSEDKIICDPWSRGVHTTATTFLELLGGSLLRDLLGIMSSEVVTVLDWCKSILEDQSKDFRESQIISIRIEGTLIDFHIVHVLEILAIQLGMMHPSIVESFVNNENMAACKSIDILSKGCSLYDETLIYTFLSNVLKADVQSTPIAKSLVCYTKVIANNNAFLKKTILSRSIAQRGNTY